MFDYVVVGAGSAGCLLAARLSEDPKIQVLLMEAGPPDRARAIRTPLAFPTLFQTALDWNDWTQPQPELGNRHLYWPRGKVLGGSGSMNAMVHMRACPADVDAWQSISWDAPTEVALDAEPLAELNPLSEAFLEACVAAGLPRTGALCDASEPAAGPLRLNIRKGKRWSAANAFLRPALQRGNLTVWTGVHARRVLCDGPRACAVEYHRSGKVQSVSAAREVVLCAGAVGSPHLLLLSGIGPAGDLEACGVPVVADAPHIGANLQDHLAAPISHFCLEPISLSGAGTLANRWRHRLFGRGPLASNGVEVGAVFRSRPGDGPCDLEVLIAAAHYIDHGFAAPGGHGFSVIPVLLAPESRGRVRLGTGDPGDAPRIDPAYLSGPRDLETLSEGVRFARRLLEQPSLAKYRGAPVNGQVLKPEEHIRQWGQTLYHPAGTCAIGTAVDGQLRVRGVSGLRVADASVMPRIPRAHPNATVLWIAERAAQLLRV